MSKRIKALLLGFIAIVALIFTAAGPALAGSPSGGNVGYVYGGGNVGTQIAFYPGQFDITAYGNRCNSRLVYQTDGNLVIYMTPWAVGGAPIVTWSSGTAGRYNSVLELQADNNVVIYNIDGQGHLSPVWSSGTNDANPLRPKAWYGIWSNGFAAQETLAYQPDHYAIRKQWPGSGYSTPSC